jgi:hypothetical protein
MADSGQAAFGRHGQIAEIWAQAAEGGGAARFVQNRTLQPVRNFTGFRMQLETAL